jgi:hypothetical protein
MRDFIQIVENAGNTVLYHLTDKANFELDPEYAPVDNAISIASRDGIKGIYLARDVEPWVNGHGYIRPFVAEVAVSDPSVLLRGRWGGELFVKSSDFETLSVSRVLPLDAHCREIFGEYGWLESRIGREFDTGEELQSGWAQFKGYRYEGDVRHLPPNEVKRLKQHFRAGFKRWSQ